MAKSKAVPASPEHQQTLELKGKDVQKDLNVDDTVTILLTAKVSEVGRNRWDENKLHQTLVVTELKKITTDGIDVDKVFPKKK